MATCRPNGADMNVPFNVLLARRAAERQLAATPTRSDMRRGDIDAGDVATVAH
jgi:hypothetical protein